MTNWEYLMGTPALAAQTLSKMSVYGCDMGDERRVDFPGHR